MKKEKRSEILYINVRPTIKKTLKDNYKFMGYNTLSEFVDFILQKPVEELLQIEKESKKVKQ